MVRPIWFIEYLKRIFPYRQPFARLTYMPLIRKIVDRLFFRNDYVIYLPRDDAYLRSIPIKKQIETPVSTVVPSDLVHRLIDKAQVHVIMNECLCRSAAHCKDYPINYGCLFMGAAAERIDPRLGRRATREEAHEHIRRCQEAGLIHMVGRNKIDTLWLDVAPGERLLTVCNCCPCCCLWRMTPQLDKSIADKIARMPGVSVSINETCTGCGRCVDTCFVSAIIMRDGRAVITDACRGCGICVEICPQEAISIRASMEEALENSLHAITDAVNVT